MSTQPGTDQNEQGNCSKPQSTSADKPDDDNGVSHATSPKEQDALPSFGNVGSSVALASYQEPLLLVVPAKPDEVRISAGR